MAATADGYIRINTKINNAGAKAGLNELTGKLKGFAVAMGMAFSVAAIVGFGKAAIDAASDLAEVQNVVDVTFREAANQINDFAKSAANGFGLSEMSAKKYAGTMGAMLKSMGLTAQKAAGMSIELTKLAGDMASFYNLDSAEAFAKIRSGISAETEPLKQLGINLSAANLEAYALAQGIQGGYAALSEQNKAMLRYNYLLEVTADAQGDFQRTSGGWANQIRIVSLQMESLKATLGTGFIAVLSPVLQLVNQLLGSLNAAAVVFANFMAAVTGTQQAVTTGTSAAAAAADGLADSTNAATEAAAAAQKQLQGFDELNTQKAATGNVGGAEAGVAVTTGEATAQADAVVNPMQERMKSFFGEYQNEIDRLKGSWIELSNLATGIWSGLVKQLQDTDLGGAAFSTLLLWTDMVLTQIGLLAGVFGNLILAFNIPAAAQAALDLAGAAFRFIGDTISAITPGVMAFTDLALVPLAEWLGGKLKDGLLFLAEQFGKLGQWMLDNSETFQQIGRDLGGVAAAVWEIIEPVADAAWETAKQLIGGLVDILLAVGNWMLQNQTVVANFAIVVGSFATAWWLVNTAIAAWNAIVGIATAVTTALGVAMAFVTSPIFLVALAIAGLIAIIILCVKYWDNIKAAATGAWTGIQNAWSNGVTWLQDKVTTPIQQAFEGLANKFKAIWDGIGDTTKAGVNFIIDLVNLLIRGVNKFSITIPSWVKSIPGLGAFAGSSIGFNIATIPRLARGAVIPPNRQFAAILGDQRSGVNIETPLQTMLDAFRQALAEAGGNGPTNVNITFSGELAALGRFLAPVVTVAQNNANRVAGRTLQTI